MLQRDTWATYKKINLKLHPPAAKAWQVSRHTPTLVWSLTLSMMLFSSGNVPPTVLPWPLMFSNTGPHGRAKRQGSYQQCDTSPQRCQLQRMTLCNGGLPALVHSWETAQGLIFYQCLDCFCRHSAAASLSHQLHFRYVSQINCAINHIWQSTVINHLNT